MNWNENLLTLQHSALFHGMEEKDIEQVLNCLCAKKKKFKKDSFVFHVGDRTEEIGLVLSGKLFITKDDFWGNTDIVAPVGAGELFGETYACKPGVPLGVNVIVKEDAQILFLPAKGILTSCDKICDFHTICIQNLVSIMADKNLYLNEKVTHITKRSIREKLFSYLSSQSNKQGSTSFYIPFNRQQLADYLSADRSAMSNELSKMRDEGYLTFHLNEFHLLRKLEGK